MQSYFYMALITNIFETLHLRKRLEVDHCGIRDLQYIIFFTIKSKYVQSCGVAPPSISFIIIFFQKKSFYDYDLAYS